MMSFVMRTSKPEAGNKYYIRKASGGYSNAIEGYPRDSDCDVLSNCVGYAYGRFNEIGGYGCCKYLAPVNAERFMLYKGSLSTGQVPKAGACMVWQKGTASNSDGAGHVAIVEKVISDTEVYTSESGYGSKAFWNQTRRKGSDGKWGEGSGSTFLGFIYNPAVKDYNNNTNIASTGLKVGDAVKITDNAVYYNGKNTVPSWVKNNVWIIHSINGDRAVIDKSKDGKNSICSAINIKYLTLADVRETKSIVPYTIKVTASALNIRKNAGTNFPIVGCIRDKGVYTIIEENVGTGASKWGKLSSGAGWIALDYTVKDA